MAATAIVRWVQDDKLRVGSLADIDAAKARTGAVWVDVSEPDEETLKALATHYPLHPLALEDMLHFPQRPKLDAYAENLFMVWVSPQLGAEQALVLSEIDVFLGADYLITSHHNHIKAIDDVAEDACGVVARGAAWTLHSILDQSVDEMFPIVDLVGEELDRIENELLAKVKDEQLQDLCKVKRVMLSLHKVVGPERDVLRAMSRHDQLVSQEAYLYLQDVGDHVARISDAIDTYRDVASSVMDIYLSAISNRLNVVMKQLTVVATIFMPLTLISGVYGMNLTKTMWPAPEWAWSFPAVIASFAVITVCMLFVFKRRGWW